MTALVGLPLPPLGPSPLFYSLPANTVPVLASILAKVQFTLASNNGNAVLAWRETPKASNPKT